MRTERRRRSQRQVVHSRVDLEIFNRLKAYAARVGSRDSAIVNVALEQYLDKSSDTALILRRLDRLTRRIGRVQRELDGLTELITTWAQVWFVHTPQLSPEARRTAQESAVRRYAEMFDYLRKKMTGPKRFLIDLLGPDADDDLDLRATSGAPGDRPQ
jgi:hypothetical protein